MKPKARRFTKMTREELFQWVKQEYGTEAEYPWKDSNAVLRRADNDKWYGVILSVAGSKLGLEDDNIIDVINLKSDPMLIGSLRGQKGYFPAYHMNKEKWISVLLGDAGLEALVFHQSPGGTFTHFTCENFSALACTLSCVRYGAVKAMLCGKRLS